MESIYIGTIYCIFYIISYNKHQLYITKGEIYEQITSFLEKKGH